MTLLMHEISGVFLQNCKYWINRQIRSAGKKYMGRNRTELGWGSCSHRAKTGRRGSRAVGRRIWADEEAGRLAWRWALAWGVGASPRAMRGGADDARAVHKR